MTERDDETVQILLDLSRLLRNLTRLVGGADDGPAMTATQRIALVELGDYGPSRLSDLAVRMGVSAPTASRAVDALHELGLVDRIVDPHDRRALNIELSARGKELLEQRKARANAAFAPAVAVLSQADRKKLSELLHRMTDAL
ncbi:MAG: MarR family winged helix-turn-helix transcriptional regulator [Gaiellaceae bacterium]